MTVGDDSRTAVAEIDSNQDRLALLAAVDHGNLDRVRNAARRLLNRAVSATRAAKLVRAAIEKNPPAGLKPFRIALLSSFSIELLEDSLVAHAYTEGLALNVYRPGFDQVYEQQILNPAAGLYEFQPDGSSLWWMARVGRRSSMAVSWPTGEPRFPGSLTPQCRRSARCSAS